MDKKQSVAEITFVAFDFETTGLYPGKDEIVEFGAVKFKNGRVIEEFQALVKSVKPIPEEVTKISGISNEMLVGQKEIAAVLPGFLTFLGDSVLMAHNAGFDLGFLRAACLQKELAVPGNLIIDTQILAKKAFPGQKSYSLQNLVAFLNFPPNQAHRALDDSIMCMKLFQACAEKMSFMGEISLEEVIA